jgi:hypothetical protein
MVRDVISLMNGFFERENFLSVAFFHVLSLSRRKANNYTK